MKSWTRNLAAACLITVIGATSPAYAVQKFGLRQEAVYLTAPVNIQNCTDGQSFSAKVIRDAGQNLPENTILSGHLHIVTPDPRASNNQQIEFCFETLNLAGLQIPIACRLAPREANMRVIHNGKTVEFPTLCFRSPVKKIRGPICTLGLGQEGTNDFKKALAKASEKEASGNKEAAMWNKRHNLTNPNQIFFLSAYTGEIGTLNR